MTKKQVAGKKGKASSEAAERCSHPLKAWAALLSEGQNRNHPLYSLESSGHRARKQKIPPLVRNEVKPDNTDNNKVMETCHTGQKFQFRHSLELPRTDIHLWAKQMQLSALASGRAEEGSPFGLLCTTTPPCAPTNKTLSAIVQHHFNKIPLSHKKRWRSISVGRRSKPTAVA